MSFLQYLSEVFAKSPFYAKAERLWQENQENYWLPLSKLEKVYLGSYIILKDYAKGDFPPTFADQALAYEAEESFFFSLPGVNPKQALESDMRKPFWFQNERYIRYFLELSYSLKVCNIKPPQTILELGAGSGWMSEFLASMGFKAIATTIGQSSVDQIQQRIKSLQAKGLGNNLKGFRSPMESIDISLQREGDPLVDAIFVFEALHHAYDWRKTFSAVYNSLKSGGWFLICREPNVLHTFISYRVARLSNTHEIGMSRAEILGTLRDLGFQKQIVLKNHVHFLIKPHWIAAQK
ncbi:class I SAM-dependent methyltransferase [Leptolyngbyaceae cyanobacterium CCMR0082]|uniref:Class I SAM-dependent methyltransferase n=1 Tax=Adonisia turfae CCMR0082 TaxID=2304604 RepID=A0A6M0SEX5_9CYAN|nr:class I SAM-dependent methyltransferase [Adonisia turfae]NEZ66551.1 class I SAM-dependent methyltransferase [Adonisia turfae CCMR0082]